MSQEEWLSWHSQMIGVFHQHHLILTWRWSEHKSCERFGHTHAHRLWNKNRWRDRWSKAPLFRYQTEMFGIITQINLTFIISRGPLLILLVLHFAFPLQTNKQKQKKTKSSNSLLNNTELSLWQPYWFTYIIVFGGPVWVFLCMEESLFFGFFIISCLLLFGQTFPLWIDNRVQSVSLFLLRNWFQ